MNPMRLEDFLKEQPKESKLTPAGKDGRTIKSALIKVDGKAYTAKHHIDAIKQAEKEGKDVSKVDKEKDGRFMLSDNSVITRDEAFKEFGIRHSEEIKGRKFVLVTEDMRSLGFALLKKSLYDTVCIARKPNMDEFKNQPKEFWEGYRIVGKNIVDVFELSDIMARREKMRDYTFIWDGNHNVKENELLRKEKFDVALGGELPEMLENNREEAIKIATKYGIPSSRWEGFKSIDEGVNFLKDNNNTAFVYKPNGGENYLTTVLPEENAQKNNEAMQIIVKSLGINDFILQEKVSGVEVNVEIFFQNGEPKSASINLECKRILAGDSGKMCGCSLDLMKALPLDNKLIKDTIGKMIPFYKEHNYTGFGDANIIIGDRQNYWIEACCRLGISAHVNWFVNIEKKDFLNTMADLAQGKYKPDTSSAWGGTLTGYAPKQRKGIPIIIPEDLRDKVYLFDGYKEKPDSDVILETGYGDDLLVVCETGDTIKAVMQKCLNSMERIIVPNLGYRNDGMLENYPSSPHKRYEALLQRGKI
jgi:phosphoribosylamine-glycine ligase